MQDKDLSRLSVPAEKLLPAALDDTRGCAPGTQATPGPIPLREFMRQFIRELMGGAARPFSLMYMDLAQGLARAWYKASMGTVSKP